MVSMSALSRTQYLDPSVYSAGRRAEFRFPADEILKSNMRLMNVGLVSGGAADSYNALTGGYGIIQSIQLFDGGQVLDQILDFSRYAGLKNALHGNAENTSNTNYLAKTTLGYAPVGTTTFPVPVGEAQDPDNAPKLGTGNEVTEATGAITATGQSELADARGWSWLDLRACLGMLAQSSIVPTSLFSNLRLVINYKSLAQLRKDGIITDITKAFTYAEPFCVFESLEGDGAAEVARQYKGVSFPAIEESVVHLASLGAGGVQQQDYNITGFDNKYVDKMLISQEPLSVATYRDGNNNVGFANQGSSAQHLQKVQVAINGRNLFPQTLENKMNRLAMMTDAWGKLNMTFGQNYTGIETPADALRAGVEARIGQLDHTGFFVRDVVQDLKVTYERSAVAAEAALNQALNLHVLGVVRKAIMVQDGEYRVMYV